MNKAIILDTETTGLPPTGEACEIAYFEVTKTSLSNGLASLQNNPSCAVSYINYVEDHKDTYYSLFMPKGDFNPKASEVNGFTKENLKGSPCISTFVFPTDITYMIGHNIMFDWQMVTKPDVKLICTKELSIKYLTKQSGKGTKGVNTLTGLIKQYYPEEANELIANVHSALQDCKLCYLILLKILEVAPELDSFEKLAAQCSQHNANKLPRLIQQDSYTKEHKFTFGKYTMVSLETLIKTDKNYLTWIVEKSTMPQDLKDFIEQFMIDNK